MADLSERQKFILSLVIHEYIRSASPVGSQALVERYRLEMSSATVRNELAALTEMGLLRQPHTSAGRVPTEEGYRMFVGRLLSSTDLPATTRHTISHQFYQMKNDVEQWMRLAASILARQSRAASLVTAPHPELARLKHLELIATRGRQVLMVLVMAGGEVHQRILSMQEPVDQEHLSQAADRLTRALSNRDSSGASALQQVLTDPIDLEILEYIQLEMRAAQENAAGEIYLDGLTNVLMEPEFSSSDEARRALRVLEERTLLQDLLARTAVQNEVGGVQVLIGGENTWEDLRQFSVVLARYGTPGLTTGTLGVLGPMRMPYGRTISTVRFMANLLSDLVNESLVERDEQATADEDER